MKLLLGFMVAFGISALVVAAMTICYLAASQVIDRLQPRPTAQQVTSFTQENKHASYPIQSIR